jgi:hypothetical protein
LQKSRTTVASSTTTGVEDRDLATDTIAVSISTVVAAAVRGGLALMAVTSFVDAAIVASSDGNAPLVLVGLALTGLAIGGGLWNPASVARLLRPRGRIAVPIALLALAGVDPGFQNAYGNIVFSVICLAAVVASPRWVAVCVAMCLLGFVAHAAVQGHSAQWIFFGAGQADLARHTVDLVLYACVMLGAITILRRSLAGAPADLARTWAGVDSLTPQLARIVHQPVAALMVGAAELSA